MSQAEKEMDEITKKLRKIDKSVLATGLPKEQWKLIREYIHTAVEMTIVANQIAVEKVRKTKS